MLLENRDNIYSDNGEDGVLKCIMDKLGIDCGTCCEFGAWDGKYCSNTFNLVKEKKWKALYIEGDEEKFKDLLETQKEYPTITPVCEFVSGTNLDSLILDNGFPEDLDLLSIDVDSIDYEIWKGLEKVRPKIVIIEPSNSSPLWEKNDHYDGRGASPFLIKQLAKEKGYRFLCTTGNLFFIRDDITGIESEDDVEFPWWVDPRYKQLFQRINYYVSDDDLPLFYDNIKKSVKGENVTWANEIQEAIMNGFPWDIKHEHLDDFSEDIKKYVKGCKLGFKCVER
jgi:hypothetical protein